jgi:lipopolysaccharide transport system permease protein
VNNVKAVRSGSAVSRLLNPVRYADGIIGGAIVLAKHRRLALAMARRELTSRHHGQFTGLFWIIGHPLFQLLLFVFLFGVVFNQKIGGTYDLPRNYTVYILSGLTAWLSMMPVLTQGCHSIISNANLVKQFTFEVEILPMKDVLISMVFWSVGIVIITVYILAEYRELPLTYLLLPVVLVVHVMTAIGIAWLLSAITVFFRDLKEIMTVFATVGAYILPVVYLPAWVPTLFRPVIYINPFSYLIWIYQDVLYFGRIEHPVAWIVAPTFALLCFSGGHLLFQRVKPLFGATL